MAEALLSRMHEEEALLRDSYVSTAQLLIANEIENYELLGLVVSQWESQLAPFVGHLVPIPNLSFYDKLDADEQLYKMTLARELYDSYLEVFDLDPPYTKDDSDKVEKFVKLLRDPDYASLLSSVRKEIITQVDQLTKDEEFTVIDEIEFVWPPPDVQNSRHYANLLLEKLNKATEDMMSLLPQLKRSTQSIDSEVRNVLLLREYVRLVSTACEMGEKVSVDESELVLLKICTLTEELTPAIASPSAQPAEKQIYPPLLHSLSAAMGLMSISEEPITPTAKTRRRRLNKVHSRNRSARKKKRASLANTPQGSPADTSSRGVESDAAETADAFMSSATEGRVPYHPQVAVNNKEGQHFEKIRWGKLWRIII